MVLNVVGSSPTFHPEHLKKRKAALLSSFFAFIPAGIKKTNTFKHLIYNILLKVHKVVDHNLVNFVFYPNIADTEYNT